MSKLNEYMMTKLAQRIEEIKATGVDFDLQIRIVSKEDRIVRADSDFELGVALGQVFGEEFNIIDGLQIKFLAKQGNVGKLYELECSYFEELEFQVECDLGLHGPYSEDLDVIES